MKDLLEKNNLFKILKPGEIVEGRVMGKGKASLFLDLGIFGSGVIYGKEFQAAKNLLKDLKKDDSLTAKVLELENEDGYVELSASQASQDLAWKILLQKKEDQETLKVKISGANKGGLLAEISGIPAFLPVSQLSPENYPRVEGGDSMKILRDLQKFIGREMEVKIFDILGGDERSFSTQGRNRINRTRMIILSEKAKENEKMKEVLKNYEVGSIVEGKISGVSDFGAFLIFDQNLEGLIHISELDWGIVENPSQIIKTGQTVKAKIIRISDGKIFLSLKALKKDPWEDIEQEHKKGDTVSGKITKINPFGAFVQISPEIQGLCHISQFGTKQKMEELLKIGQEHNFQILEIQPKEHRMSLKLIED